MAGPEPAGPMEVGESGRWAMPGILLGGEWKPLLRSERVNCCCELTETQSQAAIRLGCGLSFSTG